MNQSVAHRSDEKGITFEQFSEEWLREIREANLPPFEKGQRFATKLVTQWLGLDDGDPDLWLCDGPWDGGIDIAYLRKSERDEQEEGQTVEGDTWYIVQSKYGSAFQGPETIVNEGRKIITTLAGERNRVTETVEQLLGHLNVFKSSAAERDRIILVFATERPLSESDREALSQIRLIARDKFSSDIFDVEELSLQTVWHNGDLADQTRVSLDIKGDFVDPSSGLRVGTISLTDLYQFLRGYEKKTGNLEQLYEKNVRQFLGTRRKINVGIATTLNDKPEMFGLYNNGITVVVSDFVVREGRTCTLYDPYIVNGCQTTKTIRQELHQKLEAGGGKRNEELEAWKQRAERGVVVTKIVKSNSAEIKDITMYTNSQNGVRDRDFVALDSGFKAWSDVMAKDYGIFLEIQRGGWDAQKARPGSEYREWSNAFDLIKVYGAGWMREPGTAWGKSGPFAPGGAMFRRITSGEEGPFDARALYATHRLRKLADRYKFGRGAEQSSRRQTRFLFYFIVLDLLRDALIRSQEAHTTGDLTDAMFALLQNGNEETLQVLVDASLEMIDEYMNPEARDCIYKEDHFHGDLNTFLKWEQLGRNEDATPRWKSLSDTHKNFFGRAPRGESPPRDLVVGAVKHGLNQDPPENERG